jgi:leucyl-tRNA---protein transferase
MSVMNEVLKECALVENCAYIDDYDQTTQYKIIEDCSAEYCEALILRGWRRFGNMFFRPVCRHCHACESVKIDATNFRFSKSARRVIKKCSDFKVHIRQPTLSQEHLDLFERYHDYMRDRRGWDHQSVNARNYYMSFVHGFGDFGYEVLYFDGDRLIAVDLIDVLPTGISSIYFYYDPEYAAYSLGKYSLYRQIMLAQKASLKWIYLGYYVASCQSLAYKGDYRPLFMLEGRPNEEEEPFWFPICEVPAAT